MDGPNVNIATLRAIKQTRPDNMPQVIDIGTCSLHTVDGALRMVDKHGGIMQLLKNAYYVFRDVPARRADYRHYADNPQADFPLKYCTSRWLENVSAAERLLAILQHLQAYVTGARQQLREPVSNSYVQLKAALPDKLLKCKLAFFVCLGKECEAFLREFQTESPMLPFLYKSLELLLRSMARRVVKPELLSSSVPISAAMLTEDNLVEPDRVKLG